jgi:hypothetical protein
MDFCFAQKFFFGQHESWEEGYGFFLKKNILIPNVVEKNILILVEEKR